MDVKNTTVPDSPLSKRLRTDVEIEPQSVVHESTDASRRRTCGDLEKLKMLMLYLYRGTEKKYEFKLALNRGGSYEIYFDYGENKRICLRMSRKLDEGETITYNDLYSEKKEDKTDGEFAIQNYFISYLESKLKSLENKKDLKHLVICTNSHFDRWGTLKHETQTGRLNILQIERINSIIDECKVLENLLNGHIDGRSGEFYKIKNSLGLQRTVKDLLQLDESGMSNEKRNILAKIQSDLRDAGLDIEEEKINFLKCLVFAVNQPNERQLDDVIKREMGRDFIQTDNDLLCYHFQARMLEFFEKNAHDEAHEKLTSVILTGLALEYQYKVEVFGLEFKKDNIKRLCVHDFLISEQQILHLISERHILTGIKVIQVLKDDIKYRDTAKYISMRQSALLILQNLATGAFASAEHDLMVIECDSAIESGTVSSLFHDLSKILYVNKNKRVILLGRENDPLFHAFASDPKYRDKYLQKNDENCSSCFTPLKEKYLEQEVTFQTKMVTLKRLLGENFKNIIDYRTLMDLIDDIPVTIGNKVAGLDALCDTYMNRTIIQGIRMGMQSLKRIARESSDKFAVVGASEEMQKKYMIDPNKSNYKYPIRFLDEREYDRRFTNLCEVFSHQNIHLLKCEWNHLTWIKTRGSLSGLERYRHKYAIPHAGIDLMNHRMVIICNMPGVGKSMALRNYSRELKEKFPDLWVLLIDLNNYTEALAEEAEARKAGAPSFTPENSDRAVDFLLDKILQSREDSMLKTDLEKDLFRCSFKKRNGIAVLFDGYDEVGAECREVVIDLLKSLKNTDVEKLWVTTRPYLKETLEDLLGVPSCSLTPFHQEQSIKYLTEFWKAPCMKIASRSGVALNAYARKLIKLLAKSGRTREKELTNSVLTFRMLAEIFEETAKRSCQSGRIPSEYPEKLGLVDLFERFVDRKIDKYKKANAADEECKKNVIENALRHHQQLALNLFINKEDSNPWRHQIVQPEEYLKKELPKMGIVRNICDRLKFVNRIFAEYFVANFLAKTLEELKVQEIDFMLTDILLKPVYQLVRTFFNGELVRINCKTLTCQKFGERIRELWSREKLRDANGRTILHVACSEDNTMITKFLLDSLSSIELHSQTLKEFIRTLDEEQYERSALHCAVESGNLKAVQMLVEHGADVNEEGAGERTPLHFAAESGHLSIVQWLQHRGADINDVDAHDRSALFAAAEYEEWSVVKYLVKHGADLNIQNDNGTVLHCAAESGNAYAVKLLAKHGARLDLVDVHRRTAVYVAAEFGQWNVVKLLVKSGATVDVVNRDEFKTALLLAAEAANYDMVKWLVKHGANVNYEDPEDGTTVLHLAVKCGNVGMVKFLAKRVSRINADDTLGKTPLQYANPAMPNYSRIRQLLEENGASDRDDVDNENSENSDDSED